MLNATIERDVQRGIEPEDSTLAYASESLLDDPEFVPEIATPQETIRMEAQ